MAIPDHLIFLHIPKTAGTTLQTVIARQYRKADVLSLQSVKDSANFTNLSESRRNSIRMLKGHMPFGLHAAFPSGTVEYFTVLREPLARVVSNYNHFFSPREERYHPFYKEFHEKKYSLQQFVESGKILNVDNCMVRYLSGQFDREFGQCDTAMLEAALANLEKISLIGLNEYFDVFLMRLFDRYRWRNPYYIRRRVASGGVSAHKLDASTLECIRSFNRFDLELYQIMKPKVEQEQKQLGAEFEAKLELFNSRNKRLNSIVGFFSR
jgi:hypothetical protein